MIYSQTGARTPRDLEARLTSFSLDHLPWGDSIRRILGAALRAVEPGAAVKRWMIEQGESIYVAGKEYPWRNYQSIKIVGIGKAAVPMGSAAIEILGSHLTEGILLTKDGYAHNLTGHPDLSGVLILVAGHPIPDERGVKAAQHIHDLITGASENDLLICLISGGGSALLSSPVEGVTLADLQHLTSILLACGATITEINVLRKHLETLKGGQLARLAAPATLIALILSDVVNDPLEVIASGPCVPDPSTYADAMGVLGKYKIENKIPAAIIDHLHRGQRAEIPETPKPGDQVFERVSNVIIGSNRLAAQAALEQAKLENFNTMLLTTSLEGEASQVGRELGTLARDILANGKPIPRPACIIVGGETTVTIRGDGLGGRNQELALGAVNELAGVDGAVLVSLATDGGDGPTDAAGAVVTSESLDRALSQDLSPDEHLARNDAYHFFGKLGDLLKPGPTQTNVNDLAFILVR